jgi:prepilin-type N-terminal cleavage/methylation domain-containing protein
MKTHTPKTLQIHKQRLRAFTLVELLVVIAIIATLVSLLLPAVQSAREAGRMATCRNNVSQLAKAMLQHESSMSTFPSGGWGNLWLGVAERGSEARQPGGWTYGVLPYLEQINLRNSVENATSATCATAYAQLTASPIPVLACPSRRPAQAIPLAASATFRTACSTSLALTTATRSDYAANSGSAASCPSLAVLKNLVDDGSGGSITICHQTGGASAGNTMTVSVNALQGHANHTGDHLGACGSCSGSITPANPDSLVQGDSWCTATLAEKVGRSDGGLPDLQDGLVYRMSQVRPAMIRDGLSNTYLVGEKYVAADRVATGTDPGDTAPLFVGFSADNLRWAYDKPQRDQPGLSRPNGFGSAHVGTWAVALADGSTRSLSHDIDPAVHKALAGRADGVVAPAP